LISANKKTGKTSIDQTEVFCVKEPSVPFRKHEVNRWVERDENGLLAFKSELN
jgi:hypothetical protein